MDKQTSFHIIVIDDNPAIQQDFKKILTTDSTGVQFDEINKLLFGSELSSQAEMPSFEIDTASQGQTGVEHIQQAIEQGNPYTLAFVDVRIPPGWDGIETIKHIWELDKEIQIVICTAFSDYSWEETIAKLGMNDNLLILKKPFDSIAVRQLAAALTKKWQVMQNEKIRTEVLEKTVQEHAHSLQKSLSVTCAALESSYNGVVIVDSQGEIVDCNNPFIEMWKVPAPLIEAKKYEDIQKHMLSQVEEKFSKIITKFKTSSSDTCIETLKLKDGRYFECYSQPHQLNNIPMGRVWSFRDITQPFAVEAQLQPQLTHDSLTSLPNRILLIDRMKQVIAHAIRHKTMFSIMYIDLDRFKLINDSFGYKVGDELLIALSERLRTIIRGEDTIARLSGDEFVLVSIILKSDDIIKIVTKILGEICREFKIAERDLNITASVGISIYPQNGKTPEELLCNADLAMYRAKSLGGNKFQFYTDELNEKCLERLESESELRRALIKNEFFLEYQPQFDVKNKKLFSVEALIRWQHPKHGVVLPMDFIPLAEDTGLIVPMGEWVLKTACEQNKAWQDKGLPLFPVGVNVATKQFMKPHFVQEVKAILNETGLEAQYLEIEVTEHVLLNNINVIETIKKLKEIGVRIVLDNFGIGNSSLNYLRNLPIDRLKIDRSFIQKIDSNRSDEVIIQAIIAMADSLFLDVIATGVKNKTQLNFLEMKNCQKFQGHYFSKPVSADKIESLLKKWPKLKDETS